MWLFWLLGSSKVLNACCQLVTEGHNWHWLFISYTFYPHECELPCFKLCYCIKQHMEVHHFVIYWFKGIAVHPQSLIFAWFEPQKHSGDCMLYLRINSSSEGTNLVLLFTRLLILISFFFTNFTVGRLQLLHLTRPNSQAGCLPQIACQGMVLLHQHRVKIQGIMQCWTIRELHRLCKR